MRCWTTCGPDRAPKMSPPQPQRQLLALPRARGQHARMPHTPQQDTPREAARRLENIARVGTIAAVRHSAPARCRVQMGGNTTGWIPWATGRAAGPQGSHWWPPVVGEQCLVLSPGGDLGQGIALIGVYSDAMPAPGDDAGVERIQWSEREFAEYRAGERTVRVENALILQVGDACSVTMLPDSITMSAGGATLTLANGVITSSVDIISGPISAQHHVHGGVTSGPSTTGAPQ